jgi:hypothetical protein
VCVCVFCLLVYSFCFLGQSFAVNEGVGSGHTAGVRYVLLMLDFVVLIWQWMGRYRRHYISHTLPWLYDVLDTYFNTLYRASFIILYYDQQNAHRGLVGYDVLATGRLLQVRLGNTLTPLSEMSALRCNSKTTAFNEKQIPDNTVFSHQLMHFHIQLCISLFKLY